MSFRIFYFVADTFPAWRFDVSELFGRELPKRGMQVTWSMRRTDAGLAKTVEQDGQTVFLPASLGRHSALARIANRPLEAFSELLLFFRLLFGTRFDIIQVRDDRYLAAFWAWLAARLTGARFVYWLSFPFPENDAEKSRHAIGAKRLFLALRARITGWWLYHFMLHRADHVFVQSEEMQRDVAAHGVPWARMTPVPMGIPVRLLETVSKRAATPQPGLVAYVGTLAAVRRLDVIIEAFARVLSQHPAARLVIIGDGDIPEEKAALEALVGRLGIGEAVRFTGFLPVEQVWEILGNAAVGLSPFYVDRVLKVASPTKLVEYLAMAKPVVCNDHPEQSAIISDSQAGLCVDWSAEGFASAILHLLENPAEAERMGRRGPAWVAAQRTYPIIAAKVFDRYQRILEQVA